MKYSYAILAAGLSLFFAALPKVFDFDQCDRVCNVEFGGQNTYWPKDQKRSIEGYWPFTHRVSGIQRCSCFEYLDNGRRVAHLGEIDRLHPEEEVGYPYVWRDPSVCGADGSVYRTSKIARAAGTEPLHCGPHCGKCSTRHDIQRYRDIGEDAAKVVGPCILAYLIGGPELDLKCMERRTQFTAECNDCWVKDHGCLAAHCFYDCIFRGKQHWERLIGLNKDTDKTSSNESCVLCMEKFCSAPFIRSCGVNRRSAGIKTDLARDSKEICRLD